MLPYYPPGAGRRVEFRFSTQSYYQWAVLKHLPLHSASPDTTLAGRPMLGRSPGFPHGAHWPWGCGEGRLLGCPLQLHRGGSLGCQLGFYWWDRDGGASSIFCSVWLKQRSYCQKVLGLARLLLSWSSGWREQVFLWVLFVCAHWPFPHGWLLPYPVWTRWGKKKTQRTHRVSLLRSQGP